MEKLLQEFKAKKNECTRIIHSSLKSHTPQSQLFIDTLDIAESIITSNAISRWNNEIEQKNDYIRRLKQLLYCAGYTDERIYESLKGMRV